jgi:hypothetical protein
MILIDFYASPAKSFLHGFMKGLAAPLVLFGRFQAPELPEVMTVSATASVNGMSRDWISVSHDLSTAIAKNARPKHPSKAHKNRRRRS